MNPIGRLLPHVRRMADAMRRFAEVTRGLRQTGDVPCRHNVTFVLSEPGAAAAADA